jgi:hypothetical protein
MAKSVKKDPAAPKTAAKPRKTAAAKTNGLANGSAKVTEIFISREQVAELAHRFWIERGFQHGFDAEDWLRAEQELRKMAS